MRRLLLPLMLAASVCAAAERCETGSDCSFLPRTIFDSIVMEVTFPDPTQAARWRVEFDRATDDLRIDLQKWGGSPSEATIGMVAGERMIARGEVRTPDDVLSGATLNAKLLIGVLGRAFPKGPREITEETKVAHEEAKRDVKYANYFASGTLAAPWRVHGTMRPSADRALDYDLTIEGAFRDPFGKAGRPMKMRMVGTLSRRRGFVFDESMPLSDWRVPVAKETAGQEPKTIGELRATVRKKP